MPLCLSTLNFTRWLLKDLDLEAIQQELFLLRLFHMYMTIDASVAVQDN